MHGNGLGWKNQLYLHSQHYRLCSFGEAHLGGEIEVPWHEGGIHQLDKMETVVVSSQQRRRVDTAGVKMGGREGTDGWEDKRKPKDKQKGKVSPRTLSENVWQFEAHLEKKTKQEGRSGKDPRKQPLEDWEDSVPFLEL